jgi:hypothetical protein
VQIFCGRFASLAIGDDLERDLLPLSQSFHAGAFHCGDMNEDIRVSIIRLNKAEALLAIKPLHGSSVHAKSFL